jgi:hypothetical protein
MWTLLRSLASLDFHGQGLAVSEDPGILDYFTGSQMISGGLLKSLAKRSFVSLLGWP